ncbi:hypothetical protein ACICHK_42705 (plasmid) [Streptomyces sp. AHU1]|uniref:hypothetical protein n=1 Tax=Streptomyces sp. AHU1 TaxID=3377215 RepID=UPI0038779C7C
MTRWFRRHWAEVDSWFYFEVDGEGMLTRHIELRGPLERPLAAASLTEWQAAELAGTLDEYALTFGTPAGLFVEASVADATESLSSDAFEAVWRTARATCQARARARSAS